MAGVPLTGAWWRAALAFAVAFALPCVTPLALSSQVVRGTVRDTTTGSPIAGAVVSLLDTANHAIVRTLTDRTGRFGLTAPIGAARLQVLHIGHLPREVKLPGPGPDGSVTIDLVMENIPVRLAGMRTTGVNGPAVAPLCPKPSDDGVGIELWAQARTEFLAAVVARDATKGVIQLLSYDREIDPKSGRITRQTTSTMEGQSSNPSFAARSAAAFEASGYIDTTAAHFYGPDVDVLLDAAFEAGHCFEVARADGDHRGEVGVSFVPVPLHARRYVADIAGVLWFNSTDHAIRTLEYRYTNVSHPPASALGGILAFRVLPNGVPLIEHWVIRASPFVWETSARAAIVTPQRGPPAGGAATGEIGTELLQATWSDSVRWTAALGTLAGHVRTPKGAPVSTAVDVSLAGTTYDATSDSSGAFFLMQVLPGRYTVLAEDPMLTPFQLEVRGRETVIDVVRDSVVRVDLVLTKTRADVLAGFCGHAPPPGASDLLLRLESTDGSRLRAGSLNIATIGMNAGDVATAGSPVQTIQANGTSSFVACGIPWGTDLRVQVGMGLDTVSHTVTVSNSGVLDTLTLRIKNRGTRHNN